MANLEIGMRVRILDGSNASDYYCGWYEVGMREFVGTIHSINHLGRGYVTFADIPYSWDTRYLEVVDENEKEKETKTMETIMNKTSNFAFAADQKEKLARRMCDFLSQYEYEYESNYEPTMYGVKKILDTYSTNKGWLIDLFKKHPAYNGRGQIVLTEKYSRKMDYNKIREFGSRVWKLMRINNKANAKRHNFKVGDVVTVKKPEDKMLSIWVPNMDEFIGEQHTICKDCGDYYMLDGIDGWAFDDYCFVEQKESDDEDKIIFTTEQMDFFRDFPAVQYADEDFIEKVNAAFPWLKAHNGAKVSKLTNRICKKYDFFEADGFRQLYTQFADAINPLEVTRFTIISVHPIDFWTMSFGNDWASCHTIDKTNRRDMPNDYSGCYSAGTESYMLDESSFIVYIIDRAYEGNEYELQPKISRQMFHMGEDKLIQGRLYPQDNDSGAENTYMEIRNIVQRVIAECYGVANSWIKESNCSQYINTFGQHYPDYIHYSNCNVSFLRREGNEKNVKRINVGHDAICPECGELHDYSECVLCPECCQGFRCDRCGDRVGRDGIEIDGNHYCCESCAEDAGYRYCYDVNTGEYDWFDEDSSEVFYDEYHREYRRDYYESYIETESGLCYTDREAAELDGYRETDNGWYREDEVVYCESCERYVLANDYDDEMEMCEHCAREVKERETA